MESTVDLRSAVETGIGSCSKAMHKTDPKYYDLHNINFRVCPDLTFYDPYTGREIRFESSKDLYDFYLPFCTCHKSPVKTYRNTAPHGSSGV